MELSGSHIHKGFYCSDGGALFPFFPPLTLLKGPLNNALHFHTLIKATTSLSINLSRL